MIPALVELRERIESLEASVSLMRAIIAVLWTIQLVLIIGALR